MIQAGKKASISIVGAPVALFEETTTDISPLHNGTVWQITDINKRLIFDITNNASLGITIPFATETGTTTTTIKKASHGLSTGDYIINVTRANANRLVTKVDANTLTVASITGQTVGDSIIQNINLSLSSININTMKGTITTIKPFASVSVVGSYLPKTLVATANDYSYNQATEMGDVTPFLATHKKRMPLAKFASGTLSYWDITDSYFTDALLADTPKYIVLEDGTTQKALLAYFDKIELKASIGSPQSMTVGFISANGEVG